MVQHKYKDSSVRCIDSCTEIHKLYQVVTNAFAYIDIHLYIYKSYIYKLYMYDLYKLYLPCSVVSIYPIP